MLLRLIAEGYPIDEIIFCDTGVEFEGLYRHVKKVEENINIPITYLKAPMDFEYVFSTYTPKRRNPKLEQYQGMSWPGPRARWCTGRLKTRIIDKHLRQYEGKYEVIQYVGIAADEKERVKNKRYPLIEWNMTEADCLRYCYERGYDWDGLYEIFRRVSCWCCPLQSLPELRKLRKHFPHLWAKLREMDDSTWRTFKEGYSVRDLEVRFALEEDFLAQGKSIRNKAFFTALRAAIGEKAG